MTQQLIEQIIELDDYQITRFINHFCRDIFRDIEVSEEELINSLPLEIKKSKELSYIFNLSSDDKTKNLNATDAAACARNILLAMAQQPRLEKIIYEELKSYKDDEMFAGIILAVGAAAAMILFAATSKGEAIYKDGKWKIQLGKETALPETVKYTLDPLCKAAEKLVSVVG